MPKNPPKTPDQFNVLLVEDEENDVLLMQHAFASVESNVALQVAKDGQQAMDYLAGQDGFTDRTKYPIPGLIILDLQLPRKNGLEVLRWIRQESKLKRLPIIVFSSSLRREDIDLAFSCGANSFVVKPSGVEKRNELARLILEFWVNHNEPSSDYLGQLRKLY